MVLIEAIIFWILLLDSLGANLMAWFGDKWYNKHFRLFSRWFPVTKGWCGAYLALVLFSGWILFRYASLV